MIIIINNFNVAMFINSIIINNVWSSTLLIIITFFYVNTPNIMIIIINIFNVIILINSTSSTLWIIITKHFLR